MRPVLLTLLLLASLPTFPQTDSSQPEGTISGTVLDQYGQPFKGVLVCTYMMGAHAGSREAVGDCPAATTDDAGHFRIDHMAMATFGVEAIKPEDGYIAFAGTSVKKTVILTPNRSSATVVLKLGPKPGVLLPSVTDKSTGKPITSYMFQWQIFDSPQPNVTYSGGQTISRVDERALVPPRKYLVLTISAPGYKKWIYCDPSDPSRPALIRLQPSEEKELLVELEPEEPAAR